MMEMIPREWEAELRAGQGLTVGTVPNCSVIWPLKGLFQFPNPAKAEVPQGYVSMLTTGNNVRILYICM